MPLSFLFNNERMNRMVEYQVQNGGLGLNEMIDALINATWKASRRKGMEALIQIQTEQVLLTYLLASSVDETLSFAARSAVQKSLADLKIWIEGQKKTTTVNSFPGHFTLALERMKAPDKAKPTVHAAIPPGAPIGCDWD